MESVRKSHFFRLNKNFNSHSVKLWIIELSLVTKCIELHVECVYVFVYKPVSIEDVNYDDNQVGLSLPKRLNKSLPRV